MKNKIAVNLIILMNLGLLALTLHLFSFGSDFITGGIDGLCLVLTKFFPIFKTPNASYNYFLYLVLNLLALALCCQQEKREVFIKTTLIVLILMLQLKLLAFLETKSWFAVNTIRTIFSNCFLSHFLKDFCSFSPERINFFYATFLGGTGFGISLSYIRRYGYTTGGMDIYQKYLKTNLPLSFVQTLFLTDGLIILLAFGYDWYFDQSYYHFSQHVINRLLLPYCSLLIIGKWMQKIIKRVD